MKLPKLPEGLRFHFQVVPGGTYVRVFRGKQAVEGYKVMETYVDGQLHEPSPEYLAKVWKAAHHQSRLLLDREERAAWIEAAFDDQDDDD